MESKRHKRKPGIAPIELDEIAGLAGMSGFVSFLNVQPDSSGAPEVNHSAPDLKVGAPLFQPALFAVRPTESAPLEAEQTLEPELSASVVRFKVQRAVTAQDGHSHGEQALYAAMYRLGRSVPGTTRRRLVIGERSLAKQVPMSYSSVQSNLKSLIAKMAVEEGEPGPNRTKTYIVRCYDDILNRRREAGLTHIIRRTSSVVLVNPSTSSAPEVGALTFTSGAPTVRTSGALSLRTFGAPTFGSHTSNRNNEEETSSSETLAPLVAAIRQFTQIVDDESLHQLVRNCRSIRSDATIEEIAHFAELKGRQVTQSSNIRNPVAVLKIAVPKCFVGESFALYRKQKKQLVEEQRRELTDLAKWTLDDPESSEESKQWAKGILEPGD